MPNNSNILGKKKNLRSVAKREEGKLHANSNRFFLVTSVAMGHTIFNKLSFDTLPYHTKHALLHFFSNNVRL